MNPKDFLEKRWNDYDKILHYSNNYVKYVYCGNICIIFKIDNCYYDCEQYDDKTWNIDKYYNYTATWCVDKNDVSLHNKLYKLYEGEEL